VAHSPSADDIHSIDSPAFALDTRDDMTIHYGRVSNVPMLQQPTVINSHSNEEKKRSGENITRCGTQTS